MCPMAIEVVLITFSHNLTQWFDGDWTTFWSPFDGPMSMILVGHRMATKNFNHQGI
jgi:hypothetical protein